MPLITQKKKRAIKSVGIITKRKIGDNPEHVKALKRLVKYLKAQGKEIIYDNNSCEFFPKTVGHKKEALLRKSDLAVTLGGDGTILKTARRMVREKTLVLGLNFGTLGFLSESDPKNMFAALDKIFAGQFKIDRRSLLRVTVYRDRKKIETFLGLNDVVINQGAVARVIKMDLELDGLKVVKIKGDGLIVSTPTGSTAHSLAAGGPIVHPQIEGLTITPICPSALSMRPIVIPDKKQLTVTIDTQRRDETADIGLTIDGQDTFNLKYGDQVKIRRSKRYIHLVRTKNRYYRMLRSKLHWGEM